MKLRSLRTPGFSRAELQLGNYFLRDLQASGLASGLGMISGLRGVKIGLRESIGSGRVRDEQPNSADPQFLFIG